MQEPVPARTRGFVCIVASSRRSAAQPCGSMHTPVPAQRRTRVLIDPSLRNVLQPPCGSMPLPSPAWMWVVVITSPSSAAVRVQAVALAGADARDGAHLSLRWGPGPSPCRPGRAWWSSSFPLPGQPSGSMLLPLPARTCVVVVIFSLPGQPLGSMPQPLPERMPVVVLISVLLVSRCRRCGRRRPRACRWWCASSPPGRSAVGVDAEAAAGPDGGRSVHRRLIRWGRWCRRVRRAGWWWCSSECSVSAVVVDARAHPRVDGGVRLHLALSRWGPFPAPARRGPWSWCSSRPSAVGVDHPAGAGADRGRGAHRCISWSAVGVDAGASPRADRGVRAHLVLSRWGPSRRPRQRGRWSWCSWPTPFIGSASAIRVDRRADGGAEVGRGAHPQPSGSMHGPSPARMVVVAFMSVSFQPSGSIPHPWPEWMVVVAFIACAPFSRWGRCPSRRRRGSASWCSSSALPWSAVGIDAGTRAGADGRGGAHGPFSRVRSGCGKAAEVLPF
jgi:hypothetical protein